MDAQQLARCFPRTARHRFVREQRPKQMTRAQLRQPMLDRGEQPCLLGKLHDVGRQAGRAGIAGAHLVEAGVEIGPEAAFVDIVMPKNKRNVGAIAVHELEQPVFNFYIVMTARKGQSGSSLKGSAAMLVQPPDKRFKVYGGH